MAKGLICLITNGKVISGLKNAMTSLADLAIKGDPNAKITAEGLYNQFKKSGIDIDLQSIASIYADNFASKVDVISNYQTTEELNTYTTKTTVLNKAVKNILIANGFGKQLSNGKIILDWVKLMRLSQDEIKEKITDATTENLKGQPQDDIDNAIKDNLDSITGSWKQIISNTLIKSQNDLRRKDDPISRNQKNSIEKVSDLYAKGLFDTFKDDYKNAIRKSVGVSNANVTAMSELDELGKAANMLAQSPYGTNNVFGKILQNRINSVINKARYADANGIYKFASGFAALIDLVKLKILANPINRGENYTSGKSTLLNTYLGYGKIDPEIKDLAFQYKRELIRNGGDLEFGDVSNTFTGNNSSANKVREWINNKLSKDGESKVINWTYSQLMGTASLNGVDTYNKVINTWGRFISNMEDILVSKGQTRHEAQKNLHQEIFGKVTLPDGTEISNWQLARNKAEKAISDFNLKSGSEIFKPTEQNIKIFSDDIVKMELIDSKLVTSDELNAAWNGGYKSAGREMGHVANNALSVILNKGREATAKQINDAVKDGNYTKAAFWMLFDTSINKIVNAFVSGGTNWVILKAEKQGLGIISSGASRLLDSQSFTKRKNISSLSSKEIQEHLYNVQKTKDKFTRGVSGLITNGIITALGIAALSVGSDDDKIIRLQRFAQYMKDHYILYKVFNKMAPLMLSGYIAKMQQDEIGWENLSSALYGKPEPIIDVALSALNKNPNYQGTTQFLKSTKVFSDDTNKQMTGYEQIGKVIGSYGDINPLPTKFIYDLKDIAKDGAKIYNEMMGKEVINEPYTPAVYKTNWEAVYKEYLKQSIILPK